jgi:Holliday junction resolvase
MPEMGVNNMTHWKGPVREREVAAMFNEEGFTKARRALGAGRLDDVGDIDGVPLLCLQVAGRKTGVSTVLDQKLPATEIQRKNRGVPFAALFLRMDRKPWIVVLTPKMFFTLFKYALIGYDVERLKKHVKLGDHDDHVAPSAGES